MNGELAVLVALAATGGRWLRQGGEGDPPPLLEVNSAFQHVRSFTARMPPRGLWRRATEVHSPEDWLRALHSRGFTGLVLTPAEGSDGALAPHLASAFVNAGTTGLLATGPRGGVPWRVTWRSVDRAADRALDRAVDEARPWVLTAAEADGARAVEGGAALGGAALGGAAVGGAAVGGATGRGGEDGSVGAAREGLRVALADARAFARGAPELGGWTGWFDKAALLLDAPEPTPPFHGDLLPRDADLARRQLAAAAIQGWVLGGMGSWNDVAFPSGSALRREHERVSAVLHRALLTSFRAAANQA